MQKADKLLVVRGLQPRLLLKVTTQSSFEKKHVSQTFAKRINSLKIEYLHQLNEDYKNFVLCFDNLIEIEIRYFSSVNGFILGPLK